MLWNSVESAGQVHWTLSGRILQIPVESGDFQRIPVDSPQIGHAKLAHVTLTKSGTWVCRIPAESGRSYGGVYSPQKTSWGLETQMHFEPPVVFIPFHTHSPTSPHLEPLVFLHSLLLSITVKKKMIFTYWQYHCHWLIVALLIPCYKFLHMLNYTYFYFELFLTFDSFCRWLIVQSLMSHYRIIYRND